MNMEMQKKSQSISLISLAEPKSAAAEAYRALRTNLAYCGVGGKRKVIAVTSPGAEDGKTTTVCNLAISIAQNKKRVLLIESDMRKPSLAKYFQLKQQHGLSDVLAGTLSWKEVLQRPDEVSNLDCIVCGYIPPNPADLLSSDKMISLLAECRDEYDLILIDTPPVSHITDAAVVGALSDGILLVISAGHTSIDLSRQAIKMLRDAGCHILGSVLGKVVNRNKGQYYY